MEVDILSFNEINDGPAPTFKLGQEIEVAYNKRGKLRFVEPRQAG
jgi:hypothetical protein